MYQPELQCLNCYDTCSLMLEDVLRNLVNNKYITVIPAYFCFIVQKKIPSKRGVLWSYQLYQTPSINQFYGLYPTDGHSSITLHSLCVGQMADKSWQACDRFKSLRVLLQPIKSQLLNVSVLIKEVFVFYARYLFQLAHGDERRVI